MSDSIHPVPDQVESRSWKAFNINDRVRVRLTPEGRAVHLAAHATFCASNGVSIPYEAPVEDADGLSTWQMWELMHAFCQHMCHGGPNLFETAIHIEEKS